MRVILGVGLGLLLLFMFGGEGISQENKKSEGSLENTVVARYDGKEFRLGDLLRIFRYYDEEKRDILDRKPELRVNVLKRIVQSRVLADIARKKGYDRRAEIREQIRILSDDYLARRYLEEQAWKEIKVTDKDIETYYKANPQEFRVPEMVRARHILIKVSKDASEDEKKAARKKAEEILQKIKKGEDFATLAEKYSDDPGSAKKGGDLGFFPRGRMVKPFEEAAFSLKPGEVSEIVETRFGYHIIKVEDRREAGTRPLNKVKAMIRRKLEQELKKARAKEILENAMKDAGVSYNLGPVLKEMPPLSKKKGK